MELSTLIGTPEILCISVYMSIYYVDISGSICKKVRLLVQRILFGRISGVLTSAEQRQWSNPSRPLLCNGTGPLFSTSAAGRQRFGAKKQRSARVLTRVLEDFL
jgi:hypothetical protein